MNKNLLIYLKKKELEKKELLNKQFFVEIDETENKIEFVFIIIRHVNSELTNKYWIESYNHIRKLYPFIKIIIIDDNSNKEFINDNGIVFENIEFVESEFPKRGELLPYYYFYKNKYAENAVIIHDSVFIKQKVNFEYLNHNVKFLWHNNHRYDDNIEEKKLISQLKNCNILLKFYEHKHLWKICIGVMSFINHDFLVRIQDKYNLFNLLDYIKCRKDRMCLERIFGLICTAENPNLNDNPSIFGIQYLSNYSYDNYERDMKQNKPMPMFTKIWTGR